MNGAYIATIGLEVHAQLLTRSKMFCSCAATYGEPENRHTCPVCLGLPGALPVPNRTAVEMAIRVGLAAGGRIARRTKFDRKNYFYPDLPKGYQISQFDMPLCEGGEIEIRGESGAKKVGIIRIHLEEDAGKSLHDDPDGTLVDLNRCGVPLIEIVSAPDMSSPAEAYAYLTEVRRLVRWLGICDGNLEEGSLRCDANVSVTREGAPLGIPIEVKNLNSFHGVERALTYEIKRQTEALQAGETVSRQTCLWDPERGITRVMRTKEQAHDYRYFPEPDLIELEVEPDWVEQIRARLPELPWERRLRFAEMPGMRPVDADLLTSESEIADYFEDVLSATGNDVSRSIRWVTGEALRWRKELGRGERFPVSASATGSLAQLESQGKASGIAAKTIYEEMAHTGRDDPAAIMKEKGLEQVSDEGELAAVLRQIIEDNPKESERYRSGEKKLQAFFIGQVMKATKGKADPKLVGKLLHKILEIG